MSDVERDFHEKWLGMAQPIEGLVVSIPVLIDAQCMQHYGPAEQARLGELVGKTHPCIRDYPRFYSELLGFPPDSLETALPEDLRLDVVDGHQTVRPTRAIRRRQAAVQPERQHDDSTPQSRAGEPYLALIWELPEGLDLDRKETVTGPWHAEPTVKFERLLSACRVPVGILANGHELRLVYAPHGESVGRLTFRLKDLVTAGGQPLLDALLMLLHARRFFGVEEERTLPALLEQSRRRQANVTEALAGQVLEALEILLAGFEAAAERDGHAALPQALRQALERGDDHVYGGLLTTLLRLVFVLYAEDLGLLPIDAEPYSRDLSVKALYDQLLADAGTYPDSMSRRFGAWPRLLALFRCIYLGASHGGVRMPARRGQLFDPEAYPFLEGWAVGAAPVESSARASLRTPSLDDGTVYRVLEKLVVLEGQRLSYQALDVEQIGSVYEALMGYHVKQLSAGGVCLKPDRMWVSADEILKEEPGRRAAWLEDAGALESKAAKAAAEALKKARTEEDVLDALEPHRVKGLERRAAGRLVLQPGKERRRTSSHYTPRSLSARIVKRALEPLLLAMGEKPSSKGLLDLKICDPAMGSGAFLVEACRFLADQVVAAWTREGSLEKAPRDEDVTKAARRLVAQRCLYGVDRNPFAVNLAKLSLWLVTLAKDEPFTFLDHALKFGDSLVGLDLDQTRFFNWRQDRELQFDLAAQAIKRGLAVSLERRETILAMATALETPGHPHQLETDAARRKEELLRDADEALEPLRLIGDLCVGAFFSAENDKTREGERLRRLDLVQRWLSQAKDGDLPAAPGELIALQRALHETTPTFHWMLEFPEVFSVKRPDPLDGGNTSGSAWMDCFVGNPPFMGGRRVRGELGDAYTEWLGQNGETSLNADLSAHFFRRAWHLLGTSGTIGLIATNTIAQGDTRTTGLGHLLGGGGVIYDAVRSMEWPGAASVSVSVVHVTKGSVANLPLVRRLDGGLVTQINSRLRSKPERPDPVPLEANAGKSFQGSIIVGMGFVLTPARKAELIAKDRRNGERIFRYIGGEEINSDPDPALERYVINFGQMDLEEAEQWPDLIKIVRALVKPERDKVNREVHRRKWWQFGDPRPGLYEALRPLKSCFVLSLHTKHLAVAVSPCDRIFSHALCVFVVELPSFAVLQSRVHEVWARLLSSSLEDRLRYAPSDCFETFPFPPEPQFSSLDPMGRTLDDARRSYMDAEQVGLTTAYNRLKDPAETAPSLVALRSIHENLDREVLAAYGWSDIAVPPFCGASPKEMESFEDEVLDRLFDLNAQRANDEEREGSSTTKSKRRKRS